MDKEELEKGGWNQASISSGTHLQRILEMYRDLDFEVQLEEVDPSKCGECTACYDATNEKIYRIYTRPGNGQEGE